MVYSYNRIVLNAVAEVVFSLFFIKLLYLQQVTLAEVMNSTCYAKCIYFFDSLIEGVVDGSLGRGCKHTEQ